MVFKSEDDYNKIVIATCNCGCNSELHIMKMKDESVPTEYYLSLHSSKWDEEQIGILRIISRRLKRAWYNLIGKDYLYMDIIFKEDEFNTFIHNLEDLQKTK